MLESIPTAGAANAEQRRAAHKEWIEAAGRSGLDLTGFDPDAPFECRISLQLGLVIACIYSRFSDKQAVEVWLRHPPLLDAVPDEGGLFKSTEQGAPQGGIIPATSTQVPSLPTIRTQVSIWPRVPLLWLIGIVCGCLVLLGVVFSTVSAQPFFGMVAVCGMVAVASRDPGSRGGIAASYARYSSDMQDESSIAQQRRKCKEKAAQDGLTILSELEFCDEAISGTKRDRAGLNAMVTAARAGRFKIIYFESLSRLARESVITMPLLKELVYVHRIRIVSVSEGIDSHQPNWELMATFMSWVHEQYLKTLRSNVLRGQEEAFLNDWSVGDWCFGYSSEPIPDSEKGRRGRNPKPRKRVIINEEHSVWVVRIFVWFVEERRSLDWIARELNRLNAPKDHRSTKPGWHHTYVKGLLRNRKYIGIWPWRNKTNVRNPLTGQISQIDMPPEEVAQWERERPWLRLIEDKLFFQAQALLDENEKVWENNRKENGQLEGSRKASQLPRHLLQGLCVCAVCGSTLQVCGAHGRYLGCNAYRRGLCQCRTRMPRALAMQLLLAAVRDRLFAQTEWLSAVIEEAQRAWDLQRKEEPTELLGIERDMTVVKQKIKRLVDSIENGDDANKRDGSDNDDGANDELKERLRARRRELQMLEQRRACLQDPTITSATPPTADWIKTQLQQLHEILGTSGDQANATMRKLVGGSIIVEEQTLPDRKRKHMVARFSLTTRALLAGISAPAISSGEEFPALKTEEITVAIREEPCWAEIADEVKRRFDAGVEYERIAEELQCLPSWVAKALAWWHEQRGLPAPDGRLLRGRLNRPDLTEKLADSVKELWDRDLPMQEIAEHLGCCRDIVTAAIQHWFAVRGLPVPDGRHRRKELRLKRDESA